MDNEEILKRLEWYERKYGPYVEKRGLRNWKNLFRTPNIYEWTILIMLIMAYFISWAYVYDTSECRETLSNLDTICEAKNTIIVVNQSFPDTQLNEKLNELIIKADIDEGG